MRLIRSISLRRGAGRCVLVGIVAAGLGACAATAPTHVYSLMPPDLAARATAATGASTPASIVLEPIRLPAQADQAQWLVQLPDESLAVLEQERWASPLRDEFRGALLEALIDGHGAIEARTIAAGGPPPLRIGVDVRRFDSLPGREARSEGSWIVAGADGKTPALRCEWLIREPANGPISALAAAHRRAIVRLGDAIGAAVESVAQGKDPACPPPPDARN